MAESYVLTKSGIALSAATAKTVAAVISGSTVTARLIGFDVTFDGTNPSETPALIEVVRYTADGTGTAFTLLRANGEAQNRAANLTAKHTYTVEPTGATVIRSFYVPATSGIPYAFSLGREQGYIPVSSVLGIRVTRSAAGNVTVNLDPEE